MDYPVINFFKKTAAAFSTDGFFLATAGFIFLLFAVFLIFNFKGGSSRYYQSCAYFSITAAVLITAVSALFLIAETPFFIFAFYFALLCCETVAFTLIIKAVLQKKSDGTEEKELIKYIDGEIKKENASAGIISADGEAVSAVKEDGKTAEKIKCEPVYNRSPESDGVNFSHVKSVLDRLEYFDLSPADKKQIEILKDALYSAERVGFTPENKGKVNDGLSGLLKIMSKYGV